MTEIRDAVTETWDEVGESEGLRCEGTCIGSPSEHSQGGRWSSGRSLREMVGRAHSFPLAGTPWLQLAVLAEWAVELRVLQAARGSPDTNCQSPGQ